MTTRVRRRETKVGPTVTLPDVPSEPLIDGLERLEEWIRKPPYSKRFLRSELRAVENDVEYARGLSKAWQARRANLDDLVDLAEFYRDQAVRALRQNDPLEFHKYIYYAEGVLFFHLLRYEELTKRSPNRLTLRKYAYRRSVATRWKKLSDDEKDLVRRVGTDGGGHEDWLRLYHLIHGPRYKTHQKKKIERARKNRQVRQLAIVTLVSLGTGLTIFFGSVLESVDLPFEITFAAPSFLQANVNLLAFVILFGLFGAGISQLLLLSRRDRTDEAEVPTAVYGFWATAAKLVFGASSALVLLVVISSGVIPVFDPTELTAEFALCLAFAAGFSERLLLKAMKQISV